MRRLGLLLGLPLALACFPGKPASKGGGLEGRFILQSMKETTSTSPEMFPAATWASGLTLAENPSAIVIENGKVSATGTISLSGEVTGEIKGNEVHFTAAEEGGGTRLEIQFQGNYQPETQTIQGKLIQIWGLTEDGTGEVTLSGEATFAK